MTVVLEFLRAFFCQVFCDGLALALIKCDLTVASTNIAVKTTDALCHLTGMLHVFVALCRPCQLEAVPAPNAILIAEAVVEEAIAA